MVIARAHRASARSETIGATPANTAAIEASCATPVVASAGASTRCNRCAKSLSSMDGPPRRIERQEPANEPSRNDCTCCDAARLVGGIHFVRNTKLYLTRRSAYARGRLSGDGDWHPVLARDRHPSDGAIVLFQSSRL